ncbi:DUF4931 domain-containing protein [Falsibacillus albus]|uniref:DUF4931 domain-containing protein n=1 Tax=Falsibacillus albus TaxID=2478915 RepID=A0A3L7K411_9BACI|nr:DUF4931 domain-containing protein [Falsibacillus albus]RLQ95452.1 DUF4931 domain-containing protein [Falsibacillus albus]
MHENHLIFNSSIAVQKPENILSKNTYCPFCEKDALTGVLAEKGEIIWLKNKYPVLEDTFQTVLIETADCEADLSEYSRPHLHTLFQFAFEKWRELEQDPRFKSVIFFKNHGPLSGGTIKHPHMQIVGLEKIDYRQKIKVEDFQGVSMDERKGVSWNVSSTPRIGFYEWNVKMQFGGDVSQLADFVQKTVYYIMHQYQFKCSSYNLFFYHLESNIYVKIMPRFVTSPIFVGYSIPQVPNSLNEVVRDIQEKHCH